MDESTDKTKPETEPVDNKSIGARIRARRQYLGLELSDISRALGKKEPSTIGHIERGLNAVSAVDLHRISVLLRAPIEYFYGDVDAADIDKFEVVEIWRSLPPNLQKLAIKQLRHIKEYADRDDAA